MKATAPKSPVTDRSPGPPEARFSAELARIWPEGGRLGLAVSGGADSLALMVLTERVAPGSVEVATVDHGLRAESAAECAFVAALCQDRAIPCETLRISVAGGNLQDRARTARYAALADWTARRGLDALATAHHADDQAETLLMRLNRGSGIAGLSGIRERGVVPGGDLALLRPLLRFRRAELADIVRSAGIDPVQDPSNRDERFDRVRIRQALASAEWLDPAAIAASASHLAEAEQAVGWAVQGEWDDRVRVSEGVIRYRPGAPRLIAMRIITRAVSILGREPRGSEAVRLLQALQSGSGGNVGGVLARAEAGEWVFRPEPRRKTG